MLTVPSSDTVFRVEASGRGEVEVAFLCLLQHVREKQKSGASGKKCDEHPSVRVGSVCVVFGQGVQVLERATFARQKVRHDLLEHGRVRLKRGVCLHRVLCPPQIKTTQERTRKRTKTKIQ